MSLSQACISQSYTKPKDNYGLHVVRKGKGYTFSIQTDTLKRMVALKKYLQPLTIEWKYATTDNFTKSILYKKPEAFARVEVAKALQKIQQELKTKGLGLKFFDVYRPYHVTKKMWQIVPDERYAANPAKGSGHNRGAAVDVTLINILTGEELEMPTKFDDFSEKAHHNYQNLSAEALKNRAILKSVMEKYGFVSISTEWWHYTLPNAAQRFEILDLSFDQLRKLTRN